MPLIARLLLPLSGLSSFSLSRNLLAHHDSSSTSIQSSDHPKTYIAFLNSRFELKLSVGMAETMKMVLLSVGIMSTVVLLRVAVIPYASSTVASAVSSVPAIAGSIRTWLSPPYIYIILNCIIILIVAQNHDLPVPKRTGEGFRTEKETTDGTETAKDQHPVEERSGEMTENVEAKERSEEEEREGDVVKESGGGVAVSKGGRRSHKTQKEEEEEEEEEEEASLEETWVKIMEAEGKGERRQLKKSETWDKPPRVVVEDDDDDPVRRRELNKSATFKETARREKSMGQEELNRQAEAFIRKFKLQRLESHQRFLNQLVNAA